MKREIIKQMIEIAGSERAGDLSYDIQSLNDYEGCFIWSIYGTSCTALQKCSKELILSSLNDEKGKYHYARSGWTLLSAWGEQRFFWYSPSEDKMVEVSKEQAAINGQAQYKMAVAEWEAVGNHFPTNLTVTLDIKCPMYLDEQMKYAAKHNDTSLSDIITRLENRPRCAKKHRIVIAEDFTKRSFIFTEYVDDRICMNGGIIFHGYPEEGYKENYSVQLSPSYGWQMHT